MVSSGVVCMFTFLLFLSGYVLQQQSVRSIQEAIRRPPEPKPVPTLPPQFREPENDTVPKVLEQFDEDGNSVVGSEGQLIDTVQVPVGSTREQNDLSMQQLAYIFALEEPSHLCSALYFAKKHRSSSRLSVEPSIVLLYPSLWESDPSPLYRSTIDFMRDMQELYNLIYHPVQIHNTWDTRSQLLGELQWGRWIYDQALYLRSPGMVLDVRLLDTVLTSLDTKQAWAPLNPSSGDNPEILLKTPRGLQSSRGQTRKLVVSALSSSGMLGENDNDIEASRRNAAYVLFDDSVLDDDRQDEWYTGLKRQFDKGTSAVCEASGLLR